MKKIIIDTNLLLSFLTDRNLPQQETAAMLFNDAAALKKEILCQQEVLSEFVYVLGSVYKVSKKDIHDILTEFTELPGVEITSNLNFDIVLQLWPEHVSDYGDAVIAALCKKTKNSSIATFDQRFIKELKHIGLAVHNSSDQLPGREPT